MKHTSIRKIVPALAALTPAIASAHPGHSPLDPSAGHPSEIGTLLLATALTVAVFVGARWLAERNR